MLLVGAVAPLELPERRVEDLSARYERATLHFNPFPPHVPVFDGLLEEDDGVGGQDTHPGVSPRAEAVDSGDDRSLAGIGGPDQGTGVGVFLEPDGDILGLPGPGPEDGDVFQRPAGKRLVHVISNGLELELVCHDEAFRVRGPASGGSDGLVVSWRRVRVRDIP